MKNIFEKNITEEVITRVNKLTHESQPEWGKMNVAQMFAHCCVAYDMVYTNDYPPAGGFSKFMIKLFGVKKIVTNETPYKKNGRTAPEFLITDERDFEIEKKRIIHNLTKTQEMGETHFEGLESRSFGAMTAKEWNNTFYKHIDHHLNQFGV